MAKLYNGDKLFPLVIKPTGNQPLDDRAVVQSFNDLIDENTFMVDGSKVAYSGMLVAVVDDQQVYMLINENETTKTESWVAVGSSDLSGELAGLEGRIEAAEAVLENIPYPVTDVKVNGTTVIENGVAEITIDTGLTEDEVKGLIDSSFTEFIEKTTANETVDTFKELIEYAAEHESEIGGLVTEVNKKIESINVNGVDASVTDGAANVKIDADDIELGITLTANGQAKYNETDKLSTVLQGIQNSITQATSGSYLGVVSGDGISVSDIIGSQQTISAKVSTAEGNLISVSADGLFAAMYYEGDDE